MRPKSPLLVLLLAPLFLAGCGQDLPTAEEQAVFVVEDAGMPVGPGRLVGGPPFPDQNLNGVVCIKGGGQEVESEARGGGGGPLVIIDDVGGTCPPAFERVDFGRRGTFFFLMLADADRDGLVCVMGPIRGGEPGEPGPPGPGVEGMHDPSLPRGAIVVIDDVNGECPAPFAPVRVGRDER